MLSGEPSAKRWSVPFSFTLELAVVGLLLLLPLIYGERLPFVPMTKVSVYLRPITKAPELPGHGPKMLVDRKVTAHTIVAPSVIPPHPLMIQDPPDIPGAGVVFSAPVNGMTGIGIAGLLSTKGMLPPEPPPPAKPVVVTPAPPRRPIRVSAGVEAARRINFVLPVYPPMARAVRIQGTVELIGVIAKDGSIESLRVVSGHPLLVQAALDAVRQWRYRPTMLSGEPVEVIAPITVTFTLQQ